MCSLSPLQMSDVGRWRAWSSSLFGIVRHFCLCDRCRNLYITCANLRVFRSDVHDRSNSLGLGLGVKINEGQHEFKAIHVHFQDAAYIRGLRPR